jgi:hypothetical protein
VSEIHPEGIPALESISLVPTVYEVVAYIVDSNPSIESLNLVTYQEAPNWRDRIHPGPDNDLAALLRALQQDTGTRILTRLLRKEVSARNLRAMSQDLAPHQLIGVVSRVRLAEGGSAHIPMMDFACPRSPTHLEALTTLLKRIWHGTGFLLESGKSYHYYGVDLLSDQQWRAFLGKSLLMFGYVDDRYIGHQLIEDHCVLRLSAGRLKANVPKVVAQL